MSGLFGGGIQSVPTGAGARSANVFTVDLTATFGAIASLTGLVATATCTGLLTTDAVTVNCLGSMTAGAAIANARVSATNVVEVTFVTAVIAGVTLGSLSYRITVVR